MGIPTGKIYVELRGKNASKKANKLKNYIESIKIENPDNKLDVNEESLDDLLKITIVGDKVTLPICRGTVNKLRLYYTMDIY